MALKEVMIISHMGRDNWESILIRGALWHYGITSKVLDCLCIDEINEDILYIFLSNNKENEVAFSHLSKLGATIIFAGRHITYKYLQKKFPISENGILIYGEPYALIPFFMKNQELIGQFRGRAVLGPLLDPRAYRTPLDSEGQKSSALIMTSIGCQKQCGYCAYGTTYSNLYTEKFSRRCRPWQNIEKEIKDFMQEGTDQFILLADQFLSVDPEKNQELYSLVRCWDPEEMGRPTFIFTVSPLEILNNKLILEAMSKSFKIYPRYSIDSFDNRALTLFDLNFDTSDAMEALKFLASLKCPFRINYIFIRPGMTVEKIKEELFYFESLNSMISYMTPYEKLLIAHDLFSVSLDIVPGTSIADKEGIREGYKENLDPKVLKVITRILNVMGEEIINIRNKGKSDPLLTVINAGLYEITNMN